MAFETRYPGEIIIAENPENIIFGTCLIGDTYGSVESASVVREADVTEIEKCGGNMLALVMSKPRFELALDVLFTADKAAPDLAELITFPLAGITGRVLPGTEIKWEKKGQRMLSLKATSWDAFEAINDGAGNAASFDPAGPTYTDLDPP